MSNKRILSIDYGDSRVGIAITDPLGYTAQGLETIQSENVYDVGTIVVGKPINMNGTSSQRVEVTEKFIHKLRCKYNDKLIETVDERLTTVIAHTTMNELNINKHKKRGIVDTISAVYILETYMNRNKSE